MLKKTIFLALFSVSYGVFAITPIPLYKAPLSSLKKFSLITQTATNRTNTSDVNDLKQINQSKHANELITRYQQRYKGIPVIGAQVTLSRSVKKDNLMMGAMNQEVNGQLIDDIQLDVEPTLNTTQALALAKKSFFSTAIPMKTTHEVVELQIRSSRADQLVLVYLVSFKSTLDHKPVWPFIVVNAKTGEVIQSWNNIKYYSDTGAGGNDKVHEYWYGKDGLPSLEVSRSGDVCTFEDNQVKLIDLKSVEDWDYSQLNSAQYPCDHNEEIPINGAFSPGNDAYYFGHTIVDMYQKWYGTHALQNEHGDALKLVMRVHFGTNFDNAFWDGQSMAFGDGDELYPLVSLDVAGHEVSHGFTEQHSNLEYHDQSGALNESFSDMAGIAVRAYLLETQKSLYNSAHLTKDTVTWDVGATITREPMTVLRYMDFPAKDGWSADCLNKGLARNSGGICGTSYAELLINLDGTGMFDNEESRQSAIVHYASGIFNRAFYLLSKAVGIKKAFNLMVLANTKYWTPNTGFNEGACGVLHAANDLNIAPQIINSAFNKIGIDLTFCTI